MHKLRRPFWPWICAAALLAGLAMTGAQAGGTREVMLNKGIHISLPAGARLVDQQGINSALKRIVGDGFECLSDLGAAADPLTWVKGATTEEVQISGHEARLVRGPPDVDAIHIKAVGLSAIGPANLTVFCHTQRADLRDAVRQMLLSIRID